MKMHDKELLEKILKSENTSPAHKKILEVLLADKEIKEERLQQFSEIIRSDITEGQKEAAIDIFNRIEEFLEQQNLKVTIRDIENKVLILSFFMPNATMRLFVCVNETGTCISIVNVLPITCRNDYRTAMTAVLNRYNTHLRYGAFILDENDGEVMFKISYAVSKESFDAAIFKQYLNCCLVVPDRAFCEISKLSVGV